MDHGGEAVVGLFVARGDAAEFLETAEEVLDQMAPLIHHEVAGNAVRPIGLGRDDGHCVPLAQLGAQPIVVEGSVGEEGVEVGACNQRLGANAVVTLTRQKDEMRQITSATGSRFLTPQPSPTSPTWSDQKPSQPDRTNFGSACKLAPVFGGCSDNNSSSCHHRPLEHGLKRLSICLSLGAFERR